VSTTPPHPPGSQLSVAFSMPFSSLESKPGKARITELQICMQQHNSQAVACNSAVSSLSLGGWAKPYCAPASAEFAHHACRTLVKRMPGMIMMIIRMFEVTGNDDATCRACLAASKRVLQMYCKSCRHKGNMHCWRHAHHGRACAVKRDQ
jgi:hypothetical protein